jgi:hypothetical protein
MPKFYVEMECVTHQHGMLTVSAGSEAEARALVAKLAAGAESVRDQRGRIEVWWDANDVQEQLPHRVKVFRELNSDEYKASDHLDEQLRSGEN